MEPGEEGWEEETSVGRAEEEDVEGGVVAWAEEEGEEGVSAWHPCTSLPCTGHPPCTHH